MHDRIIGGPNCKICKGKNGKEGDVNEIRMDAYYYGFDKTGADEIDLVLSAVACAGKSFHHTEDWNDYIDYSVYEYHGTGSPVEWIQHAANDAAAELIAMREKVEKLETENATLRADEVRFVEILHDATGRRDSEIENLKSIMGACSGPCHSRAGEKYIVKVHEMKAKVEKLDTTLAAIDAWCSAYPVGMFQEPDLLRAAEVLGANGMRLGDISASNFRHVLDGIKRIIEESK